MDSIATKVEELATKHFGEYRIRHGQVIPKYCPFCGGGKDGDKETFAVGMHNGSWNCKRGNCTGLNGKTEGNFRQLCEYYGEAAFEFSALPIAIKANKKAYSLPNPDNLKELTEEIITYFSTRCISEQTLRDFKIASDEKGNIVFPFYRNDKLVYVKYRKPKKHTKEDGPKEWQMSNTEPILFNMDNISFNKPLVIVEGECDALAMYEAGVTNVVSVPCGCSNFEWVSGCYEWLESFNQIILFGDSDAPGMEMVATLMKRLGEYRCMIPKTYPELVINGHDYNRICKDANEILLAYGPEGLKAFVDGVEPAPIRGVLRVADIPYVDPRSVPRIMTGIHELDLAIGGFGECEVTVVSGMRGEGKSTVSSGFLLSAIQQGYPCCVYSAELSNNQFLDWTFLPATESRYISYVTDPRNQKRIPQVPLEIQTRIREWLGDKLWLFDNGYSFEENQQTAVLKIFEMCAKRYGCKLFLVDNLMMVMNTTEEENRAQANFMSKIKAFANKYKVHVLCVCHPRKKQANKAFENDDVAGNSVITNIATTVFSIEKPNIRVTKNRNYGVTPYISCDFDPVNRRIYQKSTGDHTVYGWDHNGIKEPEDRAMDLPEFQIQPGEQEAPF